MLGPGFGRHRHQIRRFAARVLLLQLVRDELVREGVLVVVQLQLGGALDHVQEPGGLGVGDGVGNSREGGEVIGLHVELWCRPGRFRPRLACRLHWVDLTCSKICLNTGVDQSD